jgi:hypothetical protein
MKFGGPRAAETAGKALPGRASSLFATPSAGYIEPGDQAGEGVEAMAQQQKDRSDLLRELTALVRRVELQIGDRNVVFGFRSNRSASMYFGQDFVVGCNPSHEVRRVFLHGRLYRAEPGRRVVRLDPERREGETVLHAQDLSPPDRTRLQSVLRWHMEMLCRAMAGERYRVVGCVPNDDVESLLRDVRAELRAILDGGPNFSDGMAA